MISKIVCVKRARAPCACRGRSLASEYDRTRVRTRRFRGIPRNSPSRVIQLDRLVEFEEMRSIEILETNPIEPNETKPKTAALSWKRGFNRTASRSRVTKRTQ